MQENHNFFSSLSQIEQTLYLSILGALIGFSKLLVSHEPLRLRLIIGRTILGSASSTVAGLILLQIPDIHPVALLALGSALGIAGSQTIEAFVKRKAKND